MAKKNSVTVKRISKIIVWILILALLLGVIAVVFKFTNGGNEGFKIFYLTHNGQDILASDSNARYYWGTEQRYDVKYTFDVLKDEPRDYNVKIVANPDVDFDFTVDGKVYSWKDDVDDISVAFGLEKESTYFTFTISDDMTVETVLQSLYPGKTVVVYAELSEDEYYYSLVVSSYNEKVTYQIDFCLSDFSISLDFDHLIM